MGETDQSAIEDGVDGVLRGRLLLEEEPAM
jgi:hypothetical protein